MIAIDFLIDFINFLMIAINFLIDFINLRGS